MSRAVLIMGESGSGKTTAFRNLPPEETYYIDCDKKGLSWKGWRSQYNAQQKNYKATDEEPMIRQLLAGIDQKCPKIHYVVIDTLNGVMVGDEMRRIHEKGYDKWVDLASTVWGLVDGAHNYRDDLWLFFTMHTQTERDESGYTFTRVKTNGRKLEKMVLESKFTTVLHAVTRDGVYGLETKANNSTTKTPLGAFDTDFIENDILKVIDALKEY